MFEGNYKYFVQGCTYDIVMTLGPLFKLDKRNTTTEKKLAITSGRQIMTPLHFFQFTVDLEQSGSQIADEWSKIFSFLLVKTFY